MPAQCDAPGVTAERGRIRVYPLERAKLIFQPVGAAGAFLLECGVREKAECSESVADGDDNNAAPCEVRRVITRALARSPKQAAAVNPKEYRECVGRRRGRRPDIECEAIFTLVAFRGAEAVELGRLRTIRRGSRCLQRSISNSRSRWFAEAPRGRFVRRGGERDTAVYAEAVALGSLYQALGGQSKWLGFFT